MDSYTKYLKYKKKYLNIKNQIGGNQEQQTKEKKRQEAYSEAYNKSLNYFTEVFTNRKEINTYEKIKLLTQKQEGNTISYTFTIKYPINAIVYHNESTFKPSLLKKLNSDEYTHTIEYTYPTTEDFSAYSFTVTVTYNENNKKRWWRFW